MAGPGGGAVLTSKGVAVLPAGKGRAACVMVAACSPDALRSTSG
jgi:hypothetical protein